MQVIDFAEFTQDISQENNLSGKSPFEDIPRVKLNITTQEIVEILQECRAGATESPRG